MLGHRLLFGVLMTVVFTGIAVVDGWLDGSATASQADDIPLRGTLLAILIAALIIPAQLELARLAATRKLRILTPISTIGSILLSSTWYWLQIGQVSPLAYLFSVLTFSLLGSLLYQYFAWGTEGVLANCGASCFSIMYLGLLSGFILGTRIDVGLWQMLMFVYVVKFADIGAYTIGSLYGKHKFSPKVSPGKTWEGMAGAIVAAIAVALVFALSFGIMRWWLAVVFGCGFAFVGQAGDLVESMIKRDAQQKDSSNRVPGFGGVLDIVDSPLVSAPFAYLFFALLAKGNT